MKNKNSDVNKMKKAVALIESNTEDDMTEDDMAEDVMADKISVALKKTFPRDVRKIKTFADTDMITDYVGLVIKMSNGRTFQVQIVED